jgi:hypothetical protein
MTSTYRKTTDERSYAAAEDAFTCEGDHPSSAQPELERQMAEFGIGYDGRQYEYNGYLYGRLADAIAYASLMRSRPTQEESGGGTFMKRQAVVAPTDADRTLMATLAIDFDDGAYRFEGFRYDGLSDAVNYARLMLQRHDRRPDGVARTIAEWAWELYSLRAMHAGAQTGSTATRIVGVHINSR